MNTLVLRTDCGSGRRFREYLDEVKRVNLEAQSHQDVPFEQVVERVKPRRSASHEALFQILFVMNAEEAKEINLGGLSLKPLRSESAPAKFDLTLEVVERGGALELIWAYNSDLFESGTIGRMAEHYQNLLRGVVQNVEERIERLPLLSEAEARHWLYEVNQTEREYRRELCLHELVEEQVERSREAEAVVYEGQRAELRRTEPESEPVGALSACAGSGAGHAGGIVRGAVAGDGGGDAGDVESGRSVCAAGSGYPAERLEYMVSDSTPAVVLTQAAMEERLDAMKIAAPVLRLDADAEVLAGYSGENLSREETGLKPEHLAYVIYTSGSTGRPKGVMNEHGGVVNGLLWMHAMLPAGKRDSVLQKTPFASTSRCGISAGR